MNTTILIGTILLFGVVIISMCIAWLYTKPLKDEIEKLKHENTALRYNPKADLNEEELGLTLKALPAYSDEITSKLKEIRERKKDTRSPWG